MNIQNNMASKGIGYIFKRYILKWIYRLILLFFISSIVSVIAYRFVNPPFTPLMLIRFFENYSETTKIKKDWQSLEKISSNAILAVVAAEDQLFTEHNGFDIKSIKKAIKHNKKGKTLHGGSTISQQTAKNVFLWPARSWVRKGLEAYFTILIELIWSKERIMEVYLNIIETGINLYGIEMAAQTYYHKPAKNLTKHEAAMIAACIPNPQKRTPKKPTKYLYKRQKWVLQQMQNIETVDYNK